jgi:glycosyltransferase involved in cell wall biosynthesis
LLAARLRALGHDVRPWRPWEDDPRSIDVVHLFGSEPELVPVAAAARSLGLPVLLSPITWFDARSRWHAAPSVVAGLRAVARYAAWRALPGLGAWRRRLYSLAHLLLPNSQAEADQLARFCSVPNDRLHVVPNGSDDRYATASPAPFVARHDLRDFILYPGRIEPRKNQLGFLRAVRDVERPVVILGDAPPGNEAYLARCRAAAGRHVHFLPRLDRDDPLLPSAFAAARAVVLASWFETPGLVLLDAARRGTPIVAPRTGAAPEYFGPHARYVDAAKPAQIRAAVLAAAAEPVSPLRAAHIATRYTWDHVAATTLAAYHCVLDRSRSGSSQSHARSGAAA